MYCWSSLLAWVIVLKVCSWWTSRVLLQSVHKMEWKPSRSVPKYFRRNQSYIKPIIGFISMSFIIITLFCKISSWWLLFFLSIRAPTASFLADSVCSSGLQLVLKVDRHLSAFPSLHYSKPPRPCATVCYTCSWSRSQHSK